MNLSRTRFSAAMTAPRSWSTAALFALSGALGAAGCSSVCDEAAEHADECESARTHERSAGCEGITECASACFVDAPCGAFDGTDKAAAEAYRKCINEC